MFFLMLKLVKKIVGGMLALVKLPFKITKALVGVASGSDDSRSRPDAGANTNPNARTDTASPDSGTATQSATATSAATQRQAAGGTGEQTATAAPAATVSAPLQSKYERFRQSILAFVGLYVLTILWLAVDANLLAYGVDGQFVVGAVLNGAVPAGLWYWTRQRSKLAWGVTMGYAAIMLLLSLTAITSLTVAVPGGDVFDERPVLALLQVASLATLGSALYFGVTGRAVVGQPAPGSRATTPDTSPPQGAGTAQEPRHDTTATGRDAGEEPAPAAGRSPTDDTAPASPPQEATTGGEGGGKPSNGGTGTASQSTGDAPPPRANESPPTGGERNGASADADGNSADAGGTAGDEPADAVADAESTAGEETNGVEPLLDSLRTDPADAETVRELGRALSTDSPSAEVVETLVVCSRVDDPEVRVAVCDVCADLDGSEPESILERLRIDTNDRVATTAMDAL